MFHNTGRIFLCRPHYVNVSRLLKYSIGIDKSWMHLNTCRCIPIAHQRNSSSTSIDTDYVNDLYFGILKKQRTKLSKAITLVESTHPQKKQHAQVLLSKILQYNKSKNVHSLSDVSGSFKIGLSGPPGSGKSTLIEVFGKFLTGKGLQVAVLAVDPSSAMTGGSLLGDKTRMPELSCDMKAYIRPSPAKGTLGGVTRTTNETIVLCQGYGFDIILVETVGVGQSEFAVADMVDLFCLLIPPAGGDELQGIKKGILEVSDIVAVTKSDGDLVPAANRIQAEYVSATKFMKPHSSWRTQVTKISSVTKDGLPELWDMMQEYRTNLTQSGEIASKREHQQLVWMWNHIKDNIMDRFRQHPGVMSKLSDLEVQVSRGVVTPGHAADILMQEFTLNKSS